MRTFKFFQKPRRVGGNYYLDFDMDLALINVLRYKRIHNLDIINSSDTNLENVGVPINNCWMRILEWRNFSSMRPERVEFNYMIIETNTTPAYFTVSIEAEELIRIINNDGF